MATSVPGLTAIVLPTDPTVAERLSGAGLAKTMQALCGAVKVTGPQPSRRRNHDRNAPHM